MDVELFSIFENVSIFYSDCFPFFTSPSFKSYFSSEDGLYKPWEDKNSTDEENQRAKEAYEAVLTLTASSSSKSAAYQAFDKATRTLAKEKFGYDYEGPVNNFVANFHDAVSFVCQNVSDGKF